MNMMAFGGVSAEDGPTLCKVTQFYGYEAKLLDEGRFQEWFALLDDDIEYYVPVRAATEERQDEIQKRAFRIRDNKKMIASRVERLETGIAYAETPASRTVRTVSSVCLIEDAEPGVIGASSAVICYRQRGIDEAYELIPVRRNDRLKVTDDGLRLLTRTVVTGETVLRTPNLGIFL